MTADADRVTVALLRADQRKDLFDGAPPPDVSHVLVLAAPYNCDEFVVGGNHVQIADLIRRIVGAARTALEGSGARVMPNLSLPVEVIAAVLATAGEGMDAVRAMLLADQIDMALLRADLDIVKRDQPPEQAPALPPIQWSETVRPADLLAGRTIFREVEHLVGLRHVAAVPCCGRLVELEADVEELAAIMCPYCGVQYDAELVEEPDSGGWDDTRSFVASFTVARAGFRLVKRRARKDRS
ncbi:hypothetical protein [Nonomuraea endophytica]|uniref:Uncharacterized protein n=1 Tax=Nonomuraea endophytica TaxID=714136 RepID=A0A7W8A846_9ACTN|nr:hypothetical protein [Nonomuraea endophytica]MBB5081300.1 hypothetical protein [Nonomuraea endophytica]